MSNQKPQMLGQELHDSDGNGAQILATLGGEIMRFQGEAVEASGEGLKVVSEKNCLGDLGSLFLYLRDLRHPKHRSYFESIQRRHLSVRQPNVSNATELEIHESERQVGNFCAEKR